ncbi:MAG: hypothetical protein AB8G22_10430 [Saprospiraceae bacterium]
MRHLLLFFCFCCLLGCENETPTDSTTEESTGISVAETAPATDRLPFQPLAKKDACEYLERGEMSKILQWNHIAVTQQLIESVENGKQTTCNFIHEDQQLQFRIAWEEATTPDAYVLVKRYGEYLEKGDGNVNFRVASADAHSQTIFGIGKTTEKEHRYIMRKRFGNTTDIELIMVTTKNAAAEFRTKLLQLMEVIK